MSFEPKIEGQFPKPMTLAPSSTQPKISERLDYIDALRGLAIAGVVLVHCGQVFNNIPLWLKSFANYGGSGVSLFFILSALTLCEVYFNRTISLNSFLIRRFFRIAPMFYIGILLYAVLYGQEAQRFSPNGVGLHQYVLTALFIHIWFVDSFNAVVPGGWSIGNEASFYLIFKPLLHCITSLRKAFLCFLLAVVLSKSIRSLAFLFFEKNELVQTFVAFSFPAQINAFIGGFVAFHLIHRLRSLESVHYERASAIAAIFLSITLIIIATSSVTWLRSTTINVPLWVGLVTAVAAGGSKWLVNPLMKNLGKLSYSIYIIHFALIANIKEFIYNLAPNLSPTLALFFVYVISLISSALIASVTFRYIEQTAIKFGKFITAKAA